MSDQTQMRDSHLTLREKIDAAIERITHGQAAMRIPVEATDPDMVLVECRALLDRLDAAERENERLREDAERMKKEIEQCRQNQ